MTVSPEQNASTPEVVKTDDKELNFRRLQEKYERQLQQEREAREQLEKKLQERTASANNDDEEDDEPYVDKRKLEKKLARFGESQKQFTQAEIRSEVNRAIAEERRQNWIKQNGDFYEVMQHAEKLAQKDPELAESILEMPEGFERQKLVYKNIKALGLHKPQSPAPTLQQTIDSNKKSLYYQPSNISPAPYGQVGDFSESGKKNAYEKMKDLQKQMKI